MRVLAASFVVLLAASASAQPAYFGARGVYGVYGNAAPERLPLPDAADPGLVIGARLSDHVDLHLGAESSANRWDYLQFGGPDLADLRQFDQREETKTRVVSVGLTDRVGHSYVRGSVSLGHESYRLDQFTAQPDSIPQRFRTQDGPQIGFVTTSQESWRGSFLNAGASALVAAPIGQSRFRFTPGAGVAASVSTRLEGNVDAQRVRVMPFLHLPITARFSRFAVTFETTVGVTREAPYRRYELLSGEPSARNLVPIGHGSFRINV